MNRAPRQSDPLREVLARVLVQIALRDPDPVERAAKLQILKKDGWL